MDEKSIVALIGGGVLICSICSKQCQHTLCALCDALSIDTPPWLLPSISVAIVDQANIRESGVRMIIKASWYSLNILSELGVSNKHVCNKCADRHADGCGWGSVCREMSFLSAVAWARRLMFPPPFATPPGSNTHGTTYLFYCISACACVLLLFAG